MASWIDTYKEVTVDMCICNSSGSPILSMHTKDFLSIDRKRLGLSFCTCILCVLSELQIYVSMLLV